MKKKTNLLIWLLVITSLLVALAGSILKYGIFGPLGIRAEGSIMELPFLLMADDGLRFSLRHAYNNYINPSETVPPTEAPEVTEPQSAETLPVQTLPPETVPVETEPMIIQVEESWFDDVLFIGDSRTIGLQRHGRLGTADYFCDIGMSYFNMFDFFCKDNSFPNGSTLEYLLKTKTYGKIYIALGVNGSGYPAETVSAVVDETIQKIRELQPDAKIILHSIIGVGPRKEAKAWYFENSLLYAVNEIYSSKADGETVFYIDPNDWMTDEEGHLLEEYCDEDHCHLLKTGYEAWAAWIFEIAGELGIS